MVGLRQNIDPPSFTPLPYGLLSVVELPTPQDSHWQNGVTFTSHCVTGMGALTYDECIVVTGSGGAPPSPPTKVANVQTGVRGATPFTAYTKFDCPPVGNERALEIAQRALAQVESWQVERAFWTGKINGTDLVFPHLAAATTAVDSQSILLQGVPVTGGPFDVAEGLGFLEDKLGDCYGGQGVIHVPAAALPSLTAWNLVTVRGARMVTAAGNLVAVGQGYPGTSPAGTDPAAGTTWMYATGAVFAMRGEVFVPPLRESINRSENTIEMIAERTYVLGYECCHIGALVQLGVPVT